MEATQYFSWYIFPSIRTCFSCVKPVHEHVYTAEYHLDDTFQTIFSAIGCGQPKSYLSLSPIRLTTYVYSTAKKWGRKKHDICLDNEFICWTHWTECSISISEKKTNISLNRLFVTKNFRTQYSVVMWKVNAHQLHSAQFHISHVLENDCKSFAFFRCGRFPTERNKLRIEHFMMPLNEPVFNTMNFRWNDYGSFTWWLTNEEVLKEKQTFLFRSSLDF